MNIKELKDFFDKSNYSDDTKSVINEMLADKTEVTPSLISQIKDILQKELDSDFEELGVDMKNDPEIQKIEKEYAEALDIIEKDVKGSMTFVEKQLKALDEIRKKMTKVSDEVAADKIRQSI